MQIDNFTDFVSCLLDVGFSIGGTNNEGIYALSDSFGPPVSWHTGDPETDPWEWRMRVLEERADVAYGKVFFRKSGWITRDWYPYFLAVRRRGLTLEEAYAAGTVSNEARQVYLLIKDSGPLAYHELSKTASLGHAGRSRLERTLVDLQMNLHITLCGRRRKAAMNGQPYGWASTVFCTSEAFFGDDVFEKARQITADEAFDRIAGQVLHLNPAVEHKKMVRFIRG